MARKTFKVPNISCEHCIRTIRREVGALPGVSGVEGEVETQEVTVVYGGERALGKAIEILKEIGYPPVE
jgi:copper chaperone